MLHCLLLIALITMTSWIFPCYKKVCCFLCFLWFPLFFISPILFCTPGKCLPFVALSQYCRHSLMISLHTILISSDLESLRLISTFSPPSLVCYFLISWGSWMCCYPHEHYLFPLIANLELFSISYTESWWFLADNADSESLQMSIFIC